MATNPRILVIAGMLLLVACVGGRATGPDTRDPGPTDAIVLDADVPLAPPDAPSRDVLHDVDVMPDPGAEPHQDATAELDAEPPSDSWTDQAVTDPSPPDAPCVPADPPEEACNGLDDDCDGDTDEGTCADEWNCTTDQCDPRDGICYHYDPIGYCEGACAMWGGDRFCAAWAADCCQDARCDTSRTSDGECVYETIRCDFGNPCQLGHCDPDRCLCNDQPVDCSDENPCTIDFCRVPDGCHHEPVYCDDDLRCTIDACDPVDGLCKSTPRICDDGDPCTDEFCSESSGACEGRPVNCDDDNNCTDDSCVPGIGCSHTFNPVPPCGGCCLDDRGCDDRNPCTTDHCRQDPCRCENTPVDCDDGNICTRDWCDPTGIGCRHSGNAWPGCNCLEYLSCDPATGIGTCLSMDRCTLEYDDLATGRCWWAVRDCNDGDPCTVDTCDPATGCVQTPVPEPCP